MIYLKTPFKKRIQVKGILTFSVMVGKFDFPNDMLRHDICFRNPRSIDILGINSVNCFKLLFTTDKIEIPRNADRPFLQKFNHNLPTFARWSSFLTPIYMDSIRTNMLNDDWENEKDFVKDHANWVTIRSFTGEKFIKFEDVIFI